MAQRELYNRYFPYIYAIVHRYMNDVQETEDVCMVSFTRIFKSLNGFVYMHEGGFKKWLSRIAVQACLLQLKSKFVFVEIEDLSSDHDSETEDLFEQNQVREIYNIMKTMPEGYRTIFNLYAIESYTHDEISEILNISRNTSKSQWRKAKGYIVSRMTKKNKYEVE